MGAVPLASPTVNCGAPGMNLTALTSKYCLLTASPPFTGLPTFVIGALLAERPALNVLKLVQLCAPASRARFSDTRLSLIVPIVAGSLIEVMMVVPDGLLPA